MTTGDQAYDKRKQKSWPLPGVSFAEVQRASSGLVQVVRSIRVGARWGVREPAAFSQCLSQLIPESGAFVVEGSHRP
jgi:hypothetical protein